MLGLIHFLNAFVYTLVQLLGLYHRLHFVGTCGFQGLDDIAVCVVHMRDYVVLAKTWRLARFHQVQGFAEVEIWQPILQSLDFRDLGVYVFGVCLDAIILLEDINIIILDILDYVSVFIFFINVELVQYHHWLLICCQRFLQLRLWPFISRFRYIYQEFLNLENPVFLIAFEGPYEVQNLPRNMPLGLLHLLILILLQLIL